MKRKAKPLRMWMIKRPDGDFCHMPPAFRRYEAIASVASPEEWRQSTNREGYRAVRVTVREE